MVLGFFFLVFHDVWWYIERLCVRLYFMLYLQIYCPYKHEWKIVREKYYVDEMRERKKKQFPSFVC